MNLYSYLLYLYQVKIKDVGNIISECSRHYALKDSIRKSALLFTIGMILFAIIIIVVLFIGKDKLSYEEKENIVLLPAAAVVFSFIFWGMFTVCDKEIKKCDTKKQLIKESLDSGTQEIQKLYSENIGLFDNYRTSDVEEIIKKVKEKEKLYNQEIENTMEKMKELMVKKDIFIGDDTKIKPFTELYVMDKNKIPIFNKIEQKMAPEEVGKVCKALNIENCFENSSFVEYNKAKKEREEELARMSRPTNSNSSSNALITGILMYHLLRR